MVISRSMFCAELGSPNVDPGSASKNGPEISLPTPYENPRVLWMFQHFLLQSILKRLVKILSRQHGPGMGMQMLDNVRDFRI